jgi:Tfp pilus assembly protein PilX
MKTRRRQDTVSKVQEEAMRDVRNGHAAAKESGFALILAILALMLLTMLGLALATTTSTELQIATNYRWSQQALYNAEAGVEVGKIILRAVQPDWTAVLPGPRCATCSTVVPAWNGTTSPSTAGGGAAAPYSRADAWGNTSRNFESWNCDQKGSGMGYGVVLDDGGASAPYQYVSTAIGQNLNGAFTLWIRRPLNFRPDAQLDDYSADNDNMVLVSEGIAPFTGGNITTGFGTTNRAVQLIEVSLSRAATISPGTCGGRSGQAGGGALGAGFGGCDPITGGAAVTAALAGQATGTGTELNPNQ